jgi:hypothetical protein
MSANTLESLKRGKKQTKGMYELDILLSGTCGRAQPSASLSCIELQACLSQGLNATYVRQAQVLDVRSIAASAASSALCPQIPPACSRSFM